MLPSNRWEIFNNENKRHCQALGTSGPNSLRFGGIRTAIPRVRGMAGEKGLSTPEYGRPYPPTCWPTTNCFKSCPAASGSSPEIQVTGKPTWSPTPILSSQGPIWPRNWLNDPPDLLAGAPDHGSASTLRRMNDSGSRYRQQSNAACDPGRHAAHRFDSFIANEVTLNPGAH